MIKEFGRLDYMAQPKLWKIIGYMGKREIELGRLHSQSDAWQLLQDWYYTDKRHKGDWK